ncbi:patatin-like phospholipase [Rhizoctonia solani AG-3 Rhs1AP]|uniref:Patatin-like phospholipase n=2 Tax=Rhizoctonia solani AG-3 TaxID=1086053 RepID=A0A074RHE0_9AGAM|nr:patatin-like phospholipase [Rhizoctonia solani AG-3 Rhs1AP]KEP46541.1 patatin-like phospholipase [Rhizoctonia solani 123E]
MARHRNQKPLCRSFLLNQKTGGHFNVQGDLTIKSLIHSHSNNSASALDILPQVPPRDQDSAHPLRILSLDGGGVRGLSSLIILQEFMERLKKAPGVTKSIVPADVFNLIVGTSTGGIIALMLGRLRMSADEVLDMYITLSKQVFRQGRIATGFHFSTSSLMDGVPSLYNESKIEKLMKQAIAEHLCRTAVVTARSVDASRPILMRSYAVAHDADLEKFKIWEAARATSAAPLYFRPMKAGLYKVPYLDGCVSGHCNPSWLAMQEVKHIWPNHKIDLFMSLGTGSSNRVTLRGPINNFARGFIYLASSTVQFYEMAWREFRRRYQVSPYVRLSVDNEISKIRLDDPSRLDDITAATLAYLEVARNSEKVQRCVELATGIMPSKLGPANEYVFTLSVTCGPEQYNANLFQKAR